ncbi:WD repeat protein 39 [Thraustotheca clavata]|uniref:Probable cytosolic iron-sulfur protein assembly protein CIAO1 homolog n=1 Tax=Thraustotheca clavata TaxID=74557 RepID=A0A1W0A698_9STRA|nr:WD repeat protein 39 [Thraustotheca clavata]
MRLEVIAALEGHSECVWHASWSPDGALLATCGSDKTIRIWSLSRNVANRWDCIATLEDAQNRTIRACEWSPNGKYIASVSFDATTVIWERQGDIFEVIASLEGHESEVKSITWSPSGTYLATCSRDKSVWIWEADPDTDFECISVLHAHSQDVKFVQWHPTEDILFSASYDDTICVWAESEDDWYCKETLKGHASTVWGITLRPDGEYMASCSDDTKVVIWQHQNLSNPQKQQAEWKSFQELDGFHSRSVFSIDWHPQNNIIVTGCGDDSIRLFQENKTTSKFELAFHQAHAHSGDVNCVRWCKKQPNLLVSTGDDCVVRLWRLVE